MIYGQTKDVLATGRSFKEMDGWMEGWLDGRMVRGKDGSDDGSLPCIQAVF